MVAKRKQHVAPNNVAICCVWPGLYMNRLGVSVLPRGWDASQSQGYPPRINGNVKVNSLTQEHNVTT